MKTYLIEYMGNYYGTVDRDNEDEAEYSALLILREKFSKVSRSFIFVTEVCK